MPSPDGDRRVHLAEAAVLVAVGLYCLVFQVRLPGELPTEADYQAVQAVLAGEAKPGDAVLLYPWWIERARLYAPEGLPVVGYQGSDLDSLERHRRVWVLAQPNLPRASWDRFLAGFSPGRTPLGPPRDFGNLRLQLFENGRFRAPIDSAAAAVARLQVYLEEPDGTRTGCPWDGRVHRCPRGSEVVAEWREVRFAPHYCLRMHAPGGPTKLVAELPVSPAAAGVSLEAGFYWVYGYSKEPRFTPTTLTLEARGQPPATLTLAMGEVDLHTVRLGAVAEGTPVRVAVQSQNPDNNRFCVDFTFWGKP